MKRQKSAAERTLEMQYARSKITWRHMLGTGFRPPQHLGDQRGVAVARIEVLAHGFRAYARERELGVFEDMASAATAVERALV